MTFISMLSATISVQGGLLENAIETLVSREAKPQSDVACRAGGIHPKSYSGLRRTKL